MGKRGCFWVPAGELDRMVFSRPGIVSASGVAVVFSVAFMNMCVRIRPMSRLNGTVAQPTLAVPYYMDAEYANFVRA